MAGCPVAVVAHGALHTPNIYMLPTIHFVWNGASMMTLPTKRLAMGESAVPKDVSKSCFARSIRHCCRTR